MARQRFTKQEKIDFREGVEIEWQNGAHWHPGIIVDSPSQDPEFGWWRIGVRHAGRKTATIDPGQYVTTRPGKVRLPQRTA